MYLNQLYYFREVAKTCNMTAAAKSLYISQSTLSKAVKELESELGCALFTRVGKKLELNYYGAVLLPMVEALLADVDSLPARFRTQVGIEKPVLVIDTYYPGILGAIAGDLNLEMSEEQQKYSVLRVFLPHIYDQVNLQLKASFKKPRDIVGDIMLGLTDIAILAVSPRILTDSFKEWLARKKIGITIIEEDELLVVCQKGSELSKKKIVNFSELDFSQFQIVSGINFLTQWLEELIEATNHPRQNWGGISVSKEQMYDILKQSGKACFFSSYILELYKAHPASSILQWHVVHISSEGAKRVICLFYNLQKDIFLEPYRKALVKIHSVGL